MLGEDGCVIYPTRLCPPSRHDPCLRFRTRARLRVVRASPAAACGYRLGAAARAGTGDSADRPRRRHRDAQRRARLRPAARDRHGGARSDPERPAADQPVRVARRHPGAVDPEPVELRAGPAAVHPRLRCAREFRRPRRAPVPGLHSGDDAGRAGADRQLQPRVGAAHRSAARAVFIAVRQRGRRRHLGVHRRWARDPHRRRAGDRRQLRNLEHDREGGRAVGGRQLCHRRQLFHDRRLSRPQRGVARARQRTVQDRRVARHVDRHHRQRALPARGAGPARPDARAMGSESAPGGPCGHAIRHAQDREPEAGRRDGRAAVVGRHRRARDGLRRAAIGAPVPRAVRDRRNVVGRRDRPRRQLWRRRRPA